jgi:NAD(P)-dependent dehydrogenase (short-subunit alcohol dehydrogenase family)
MSFEAQRRLAGKVALVTGATSGIGLETASALAGLGATVILGARNRAKAEDVAMLIRKRYKDNVHVEVGPDLDLKSLDGVRRFVEEFERQGKPLHILVNNAGLPPRSAAAMAIVEVPLIIMTKLRPCTRLCLTSYRHQPDSTIEDEGRCT